MSSSISVRPANPEDRAAVISFCQNTFSWGDYIAEVYDNWLVDPNGQLIVGLVQDRPVALVHVALLNKRVAWMEGMRVHPDFRRLGLATAVDTAGRQFAHKRGRSLARLATSIKNIPAQKALMPLGYRLLTRTDSWEAPPLNGGDPQIPVASQDDANRILAMWEQSSLRPASAQVLQDPEWRWTELTGARLRMQIQDQGVRVLPSGFSIIRTYSDSGGSSEYNVEAIIGDPETIRTLALGARVEAGYRGFTRLEAMVANDDRLAGILSCAGYIRDSAMLIYEIDL